MKTPYDEMMVIVREKENCTGLCSMQVSGFPPQSFYEDFNKNKKEKDPALDFLCSFSRDDDYDYNEDDDDDNEDEEPDYDSYYRTLNQSEVDTIKFVFVPKHTQDRIDTFVQELVGENCGFMSGLNGDSSRQICTINQALNECAKLLGNKGGMNCMHFFELYAVTYASFQIDWWFVTYNHGNGGDEIVEIADTLSTLWTYALQPDFCTEAGIDQDNRQGFMALLDRYNAEDWNTDKLSKMDTLYTPDQAEQIHITYD